MLYGNPGFTSSLATVLGGCLLGIPEGRIVTISLSYTVNECLLIHNKNEYPNEACAFLFGDLIESTAYIKEIVPITNVFNSPLNFGILKRDIEEIIVSREHLLCGFYHSHRKSSFPSISDIKSMKKCNFPWLIGRLSRNSKGKTNLSIVAYKNHRNHIVRLITRIEG